MPLKTKKHSIDLAVIFECISCKRRKMLVDAEAIQDNEVPICQFCYLPMEVKAASGKRIKRPWGVPSR
jgi:transcription elongation factor Elf1